jgi:type I restriction enzyme S subunit
MQQLFPREGEAQPRLRFPEFRKVGEWVTRPFAALYDFKPTNTFSREQLSYESGSVKNIHYGDIHTRFSTSFRIREEVVPFVKPTEPALKQRLDAYCQEGDMVFADASEDLADVGKSIELVDLNGEKVLSGSHTILARQKANVLAVGFAGHLFRGRAIRAQIERESQGTKVLQVSPGRLARISVAFPEERDEQHRIAECLSSLDALIAAEKLKHAALQLQKRGLMQQLFPSPEEAEA